MVPVVTVITSNHRTSVIRLVASGTNPDLVSTFISDLQANTNNIESHKVEEQSSGAFKVTEKNRKRTLTT